MTQKQKPLDTEALAGEVSKGLDESDKLGARLERYSTAKRRAIVNLNTLKNLQPNDDLAKEQYRLAAARLSGCGNYLAFKNYYTVGKTRLSKASFCKQHLICPLCAIRRGAKTLEAYLSRYRLIKAENPSYKLSMITLTVANGDNLAERFEHLQKSVQRLFKHRRKALNEGKSRTEWRKVHGYVGTYEVTNKGNGWHPHAHIMVLHTSSFDYKAMQAEWKEITGDSHVLNVTAAIHPEEPERDFLEVFKYAVKFSDLEPEQNIHAWKVLKARRLLFCGGAFRGVEVPEDMTDEPLDTLPYIELFYRYTSEGYSLFKTYEAPEPPAQCAGVAPAVCACADGEGVSFILNPVKGKPEAAAERSIASTERVRIWRSEPLLPPFLPVPEWDIP